MDDPLYKMLFSGDAPPPAPPDQVPVRDERYFPHIDSERQGGQGRVVKMYDRTLDRDVALKELRPDRVTPAAVARLTLEARLTSQIQHPNTVPVYDLFVDGPWPYFTMRFVGEGKTLHQGVRDFHSARPEGWQNSRGFRRLLTQFVLACQGVSAAHAKGVIHRDLSTANVAVEDEDSVFVIDWGHAARLGDRREDATPAHSSVGTAGFRSPRLAGPGSHLADASDDVYSLGVILFWVLTGGSPFDLPPVATDESRRTEMTAPRPTACERLTGVPNALSGVCAMAMNLDPARRYGSAAALANAIRNWLADEPSDGYRDPPATRIRRWAKRRPRLTTLAAALVLIPALVGWPVYSLFRGEIDRRETAERERETAERERGEFRQTAIRNSSTVGRLSRLVQTQAVGDSGAILQLLTEAVQQNQELLAKLPNDRETRARTASDLAQAAEVYLELARTPEARAAAERSVALYRSLRDTDPTEFDHQVGLANALRVESVVRGQIENVREPIPLLREAAELCLAALQQRPDDPAAVLASVRIELAHANVRAQLGDMVGSEERCRRVIAKLVRSPDRTRADPALQQELLRGRRLLGTILFNQNDLVGAEREYREGEAQVQLLRKQRTSTTLPKLEFSFQSGLSGVQQWGPNPALALPEIRRAEATARAMLVVDPRNVFWQNSAANALRVRLQIENPTEVADYERLVAQLLEVESLLAVHSQSDPVNTQYQSQWATMQRLVALAYSSMAVKVPQEATKHRRECRRWLNLSGEKFERLVALGPDDFQSVEALASVHYLDAMVARQLGDAANAGQLSPLAGEKRAYYLRQAEKEPDTVGWSFGLAEAETEVGLSYFRQSKAEEACRCYEAALAHWRKLAAHQPEKVEWKRRQAKVLELLSDAVVDPDLRQGSTHSTAFVRAAEYRAAEDGLLRAIVEQNPDSAPDWQALATQYEGLVNSLMLERRNPESERPLHRHFKSPEKVLRSQLDCFERAVVMSKDGLQDGPFAKDASTWVRAGSGVELNAATRDLTFKHIKTVETLMRIKPENRVLYLNQILDNCTVIIRTVLVADRKGNKDVARAVTLGLKTAEELVAKFDGHPHHQRLLKHYQAEAERLGVGE